jgi:hypothetical protein
MQQSEMIKRKCIAKALIIQKTHVTVVRVSAIVAE